MEQNICIDLNTKNESSYFRMRKSSINKEGKFSFINYPNIVISLDIGGTLTKIAILTPKIIFKNNPEVKKKFDSITFQHKIEVHTGGFLCSISNNSEIPNKEGDEYNDNIKNAILFLIKVNSHSFENETLHFLSEIITLAEVKSIRLTGGGSLKYNNIIKEKLNVEIVKMDELQSLIYGYFLMNEYSTMYHLVEEKLNEILKNAKENKNGLDSLNYKKVNSVKVFTFPHLVVNIGSGVSIVKVFSESSIERVGGTMCGGGTLLGLAKLLLGTDNFSEIVEMARQGDHRNLDLLVSDIYGKSKVESNSKESLNLENDLLASSFGKVYQKLSKNSKEKFSKEDIAQSLVLLISFQIAQLGYLYAEQNKIKHICYFGNFTQSGAFTIELLNHGTKFWDNSIQCHFNDLDGFLGSIGNLAGKFA